MNTFILPMVSVSTPPRIVQSRSITPWAPEKIKYTTDLDLNLDSDSDDSQNTYVIDISNNADYGTDDEVCEITRNMNTSPVSDIEEGYQEHYTLPEDQLYPDEYAYLFRGIMDFNYESDFVPFHSHRNITLFRGNRASSQEDYDDDAELMCLEENNE